MVKHLLLWVALWMLPVIVSASTLRIDGADAEVEMGKYLNLRIVYEGETTVGSADLRRWMDDFHIDLRERDSENLVSGEIRTTQQLRLYPRAVGEAVLERIALGGAVAGPLRVNVVPTVRNGIDGTPRWLSVPDRVWQGQTFEIGVEAALMHPSNHIAVEDLVLPGFDVQPLPRQTQSRDGVELIQLRWRVTALDVGRHTIKLPPIEQRGRGRWRFFLSEPGIRVTPLPSYLPPSVPVGEVTLDGASVQIDAQIHWQLLVRNRGRLPHATYGLGAALANAAGIGPDSVEVSGIETDPATGFAMQRYRVPVPAWSLGLGQGPEISVRYFDTREGRLASVRTHLPAVWRLPAYAALALSVIGGTAFIAVVGFLYRQIGRLLVRRRFVKSVLSAPDAHELRRRLIASGGYATVSDWAAARDEPGAADLAGLINAACFSSSTPQDVSSLQQALRRARLP